MDKPREFWIHDFPKNEVTPWTGNPVAYRKYTNVVDLPGGFWPEKYSIHVLESTPLTKNAHKMYEALKDLMDAYAVSDIIPIEKIEAAQDALKAVEIK